MHLIDLVQWPAMVATILASWWVGSQKKHRRGLGFGTFLISNILWVIWGWHDHAYALIALQFALAAMNIRGVAKNEPNSRGQDVAVEERKIRPAVDDES